MGICPSVPALPPGTSRARIASWQAGLCPCVEEVEHLQVVIEDGAHLIEVARSGHVPVGQTSILPPVARAPLPRGGAWPGRGTASRTHGTWQLRAHDRASPGAPLGETRGLGNQPARADTWVSGPELLVSGGNCAVKISPLNLMGTHVPAWIACTYRVCAYRSVNAATAAASVPVAVTQM